MLYDNNIPRVFFMVMLLFGFNDIANLVPVRPRPSSIHFTHTDTHHNYTSIRSKIIKVLTRCGGHNNDRSLSLHCSYIKTIK